MMKTLLDNPTFACPNHNGSFDCNPFCRLCEGNQETDLDTLVTYAYSVSWDGCHKIYLNMDKAQHDKMIGYGYTRTMENTNPYITAQEIEKWYEDSCSLRFIDAVFSNDDDTDKFVIVVSQFEGENDE